MDITGIDALERAIEVLGTQGAAARAVGVTPQAVSEIVRKGRRVPAEWCIPLEEATAAKGERITRHQLRPDLWPAPAKTQKTSAKRVPDSRKTPGTRAASSARAA